MNGNILKTTQTLPYFETLPERGCDFERSIAPACLDEKADRACSSAQALLDLGDVDGACNPAYYAMFSVLNEVLKMKNITLKVDENLIEAALEQAQAEHTTLDELIQSWLEDYVQRERRATEAIAVMRELQGKLRVGRKLTREEMNER